MRDEVIAAWEQRPPAPSAITGVRASAGGLRSPGPVLLTSAAPWRRLPGCLGDEALLARVCATMPMRRSVRWPSGAGGPGQPHGAGAPRSAPARGSRGSARRCWTWPPRAMPAWSDPDLSVRRSALALLALPAREDSHRRRCAAWALPVARSPDPWMRARGAELLHAEGARGGAGGAPAPVARLLSDGSRRRRDRAGGVRDARHAPVATAARHRTHADPELRASAYTWLLRRADATAFQHLCAALRDSSEPERVVAHLEAMTLIFPDEVFATAPDLEQRRPSTSSPGQGQPRSAAPPEPLARASLASPGEHGAARLTARALGRQRSLRRLLPRPTTRASTPSSGRRITSSSPASCAPAGASGTGSCSSPAPTTRGRGASAGTWSPRCVSCAPTGWTCSSSTGCARPSGSTTRTSRPWRSCAPRASSAPLASPPTCETWPWRRSGSAPGPW